MKNRQTARSERRRQARANRRAEGRRAMALNAQKKGKHEGVNESAFYAAWKNGRYHRISTAAKLHKGKRSAI